MKKANHLILDMMVVVEECFHESYPAIPENWEVQILTKPKDREGNIVKGYIQFFGKEKKPIITLASDLSFEHLADIYCHELCHIPFPDPNHGKEWENAYDTLYEKCEKTYIKMFDEKYEGFKTQHSDATIIYNI